MALQQPKLPKPKQDLDRIAFAGPMCVGKTALADVLVGNAGYTKLSFASKLKSLAYSLYGVTGKDNQSRKLLQELADDLKKWDHDLFITQLLLDAQLKIKSGYSKIVVDDLRFESEAIALANNGFTIIKVTCDEFVRKERISRLYPDTDPARENHPSEREWMLMKYDTDIDSTTFMAFYDILMLIERNYGNKNSLRW